jgi:hypothetical protein
VTTNNGGQRKSDRTRAAILTAARERFATHTYDRASLRAIAPDADIDPEPASRPARPVTKKGTTS